MDEFEISDRAHEAGTTSLRAHRADHRDMPDAAADVLRTAGPLVVAAELRRLANRLIIRSERMREEDGRGIRSSAMAEAVAVLRQQADELDPDGGA